MSNNTAMPAPHVPGIRYFHGRYFIPVAPPGARQRSVTVTGTTARTRSYVVAVPAGPVNGYPEWSLSCYPPRPAYAPRHARAA